MPLTIERAEAFQQGSCSDAHTFLGGHLRTDGADFALWAPAAAEVFVVGDFNDWKETANALEPLATTGLWTGRVDGACSGQHYKYFIRSRISNQTLVKADPFARWAEIPPHTASRLYESQYRWGDAAWMQNRRQANALNAAVATYEVHLGSWRRDAAGQHRSYRDLAPELAAYVLDLGFNQVELMPVMEHPFAGSWGYQITGYFAPTARFGEPDDLRFLIDHLHQAGIGVVLDWVPSHFPADPHGLARFDGTHLFEHADPRKGFHPDWTSWIFNLTRPQVRNFLLSNACYWLDEFHADGLRVDAVASMLYLDYSRKEGEWERNRFGGRENLEAISFLRDLNATVYARFPDVQVTAEESTAWPMVTRPSYVGGLGFGLKWDMGWMHDTLEYMRLDPIHRRFHHQKLTFRSMYATSENYILPLSHDEVVHGKGSLLGKMPGDRWRQFANLRLLLSYQFLTPGHKLLFMGGELASLREWNHDGALDWPLLETPANRGVRDLVRDLAVLYRSHEALHRWDHERTGFRWIEANDTEQSVVAFLRGAEGRHLCVLNLTPVVRRHYRLGVPYGGKWRELLNTDAEAYGGSGVGNLGQVEAEATPSHLQPYSIELVLPPLAAVMLTASQ